MGIRSIYDEEKYNKAKNAISFLEENNINYDKTIRYYVDDYEFIPIKPPLPKCPLCGGDLIRENEAQVSVFVECNDCAATFELYKDGKKRNENIDEYMEANKIIYERTFIDNNNLGNPFFIEKITYENDDDKLIDEYMINKYGVSTLICRSRYHNEECE